MRKCYYAFTKADFILRPYLFVRPDLKQGKKMANEKNLILICKIIIILKFKISEDNKIQGNVQLRFKHGVLIENI